MDDRFSGALHAGMGIVAMEKQQSQYKVYCQDARGQISMAELIVARDDQDAIRQAQAMKRDALKCEVWQGARLVSCLAAQDLVA